MAKKKSLDDRAYEKVKREFDDYIADIKTKSPAEIVEAAYEITYKQEILNMFEWKGAFTNAQSRAILRTKKPLDMLYQEWLNYDGSIVDMLKDSVMQALEKEIKHFKVKQHNERESR